MINLLLIYLRISYLFYIAKAQFSSVINVDCDFQFEYYTKEEVTSVLETCYLDNLVKTDGYTTSNKYALAEIKNFEAAYTTVHLFKKSGLVDYILEVISGTTNPCSSSACDPNDGVNLAFFTFLIRAVILIPVLFLCQDGSSTFDKIGQVCVCFGIIVYVYV
eukprot:GHVR01012677.1.p1 GENE.GHVR01012677.1~~GHVR01012677.1.p1  ORF type:complete len:162 (-),score=22.36 GHVR01012677.1:65-550(-)